MYDETTERPSTPALISAALSHLSRLVETEIRLAKAEMSEKVSVAVRAVVVLAFSIVLVIAALVFLLLSASEFLVYLGMVPFQASLLLGVILVVLAGIAVWFALRSLSASGMTPKRSITQLRRNTDALKDEVT